MFSLERSSSEPLAPQGGGSQEIEGYERKYSVKDGAERAHRRTEFPVGGPPRAPCTVASANVLGKMHALPHGTA